MLHDELLFRAVPMGQTVLWGQADLDHACQGSVLRDVAGG